jgi:hypothetical protein
MRWLAVSLLVLGACRESGSAPPVSSTGAPTTQPTVSSASSGPRPDENGMPEPISVPTVEAICKKAQCSGAFASVTAWYDAKGRIALYVHGGDIQSCSHPPTVYFDRDANEVGAIPNKPIVPGSDEAKGFDATRERLTKDLKKGGAQSCPNR